MYAETSLPENRMFTAEIRVDMRAIELKKMLITRIAEIDDVSLLKAIKTILDAKAQVKTLSLTPEQRMEIAESKMDIERGLHTDQAELDKEFDKWLSAK